MASGEDAVTTAIRALNAVRGSARDEMWVVRDDMDGMVFWRDAESVPFTLDSARRIAAMWNKELKIPRYRVYQLIERTRDNGNRNDDGPRRDAGSRA